MLAINSIVSNALLFSSLLLVIGVPVFYMTQTNPEDNRNPNIKKIEILAGVWFHLVQIWFLLLLEKDCLAMDFGWQPFDFSIFNQRIIEEYFFFAFES